MPFKIVKKTVFVKKYIFQFFGPRGLVNGVLVEEKGLESPAMGSPWVPMENPRMSGIMDFNETHYSVRQNGGSTGSSSIRNVFPLHSVTSKRPESPYGAKYFVLAENLVFQFFGPRGLVNGPRGLVKAVKNKVLSPAQTRP